MILHGTWVPCERSEKPSFFVIWGEKEPDVSGSALLCSPEEILSALEQVVQVSEELSLHREEIQVNLPVINGKPLSSLYAPRTNEGEITLQFCTVDGISFIPKSGSTEASLSVLQQLANREEAGIKGIDLGDSLVYWNHAAAVVTALLADRHYVPYVETTTQGSDKYSSLYYGVWDPLLDDPGIFHKISALQEGMPAVCDNVFAVNSTEQAGKIQSIHRVRHFIQTMMDQFIRESIPEEDVNKLMKSINPKYVAPLKPTEHWLHSLFGSHKAGGVPALEWIVDGLQKWKEDVVHAQSQRSFRTCFYLEEPENSDYSRTGLDERTETADTSWKLRFYLQAEEDQSLLVPAEFVWKEPDDQLYYLNHLFNRPQERLLKDLGRAADLYAPLHHALQQAAPYDCPLHVTDAYVFLQEGAALLEKQGFGVFLPSWWRKSDTKAALRMNLRSKEQQLFQPLEVGQQASLLGFDSLLHFEWQIALGDESLSKEQFEQLAALKIPLLRVKGKWIEFAPSYTNELLKLLEQRLQGTISLGDAIQLALETEQAHHENDQITLPGWTVPLKEITAEGAIGKILEMLKHTEVVPSLDQPHELLGTLRPYQIRGYSWLVSMREMQLGACLADDMGLGKTIQWISYMLYLKQHHLLRGPALLICPTSVMGNWQRELERFAPSLDLWVHYGPSRLKGEDLAEQAAQFDIVLTSYATAQRDEENLSVLVWETVSLDEAQNIKNSSAKQTQAIRRLQGRHRIALTGTPVENRLEELWSIMEFLNPDYLGAKEQFLHRFSLPIEKKQDQTAARKLHRIVQPFVMRRVKTDQNVIQDLPDKQEMKVYCPLTREQVTLYEAYVREAFRKMEKAKGMERRGIILATLTHLKQICNHPAHFLGQKQSLDIHRSGKLMRLTEMIEEIIEQGERMLLFTQYAVMAELLKPYLEQRLGREIYLLHGKTPRKKRDEMIVGFQEHPDAPPIFILSLKTGGYGLNLTRANHVFHFDRWWNPAVENQATDRAYRIGQDKNVQVHKFICVGTLEERIDQMIENKQALATSVIGTGEEWLTEMSTDDLKDIFMLRRNILVDGED